MKKRDEEPALGTCVHLLAMEFKDPLNIAEDDTFETHETRWLFDLLIVFNHLHVTLERERRSFNVAE